MSAETKDTNKRKVAEAIWMNYFNERLYEQGLIDEKTRNKLCIRIREEQKKR